MSASRSRARFVVASAALLLAATLAGAPAMAAPRAPSRAPTAAPQRADHATTRQAMKRGHVRVDRLPKASGGDTSSNGSDRMTAPASAEGTSVLPPIDFGSTNATPAPTLTKLPVLNGTADFPKPGIAVGPDHVVRSDELVATITDRNGGGATTIAYADLFLLPAGFNNTGSQAQMHYDPIHARWVAVETSLDCVTDASAHFGHGYLDFAVSDTANPNLGWEVYYYTYDDAVLFDAAYGSSGDKIVLTTQFQSVDGCGDAIPPTTSDATAMDWSGLTAGQFEGAYWTFEPNDEDVAEWIVPAVRTDGANDDLELLISFYTFASSSSEAWLFRIFGSGATIDGVLNGLPVPPFATPPPFALPLGPVVQGGRQLSLPNGPTSVFAHGERLVAAANETCTPAGDSTDRACARIVDLDTSVGDPLRVQDFFLAANGKDTYDPGVVISTLGDLFITYLRSTSSTGPTASVVRQSEVDAVHTVSAARTLGTSTGIYGGVGLPRFVQASVDPLVTDAVWVQGFTGLGDVGAYRNNSGQARTATGDTYVPLPSTRVLDTRPGGTGLAGPFSANVPRTFGVAGVLGIPAGAVAVTANVTVTGQTSAGYLAVTPAPTASPSSSTINFPLGDNRGNNTTIPLAPDGSLAAVFKAPAGRTTQLIVDVTGYFLADDTAATYKTVTPKRILDSRAGVGTGLSGRFVANTPRALQVTGTAGVPAGALAVTGNLSVVNQTKGGYVSVTPDGDATDTSSSLNFPLGDVRGNGLTAQLGGDGRLWLNFKASGGTTDLIFDVTGYYLAGTTGLRFYPLNPARIMDTRFNTLTQLFGAFNANVSRTLVTGGHFGVPGNAKAVTGNLTVVGQTKAGYVGITLAPTPTPPVSSLNFPLGDVRGNGVTVPLNGANDMVLIYKASTGAKTHLILDLTGYFR